MFEKASTILLYRDPTFPKDADGLPDGQLVRQINYSHTFLRHAHTGAGKMVNQEVFQSKVLQSEDLPSMEEVNTVISYHRDQIDGLLGDMEAVTVNVKKVNVGVSRRYFFFVQQNCYFLIYRSQSYGES